VSESVSVNADRTIITWNLHIKHFMDYAAAMDHAYSDGGIDAGVSMMSFGVASCYRASYSKLVSVEHQWANSASVFANV
jgi:hypothetical protein